MVSLTLLFGNHCRIGRTQQVGAHDKYIWDIVLEDEQTIIILSLIHYSYAKVLSNTVQLGFLKV